MNTESVACMSIPQCKHTSSLSRLFQGVSISWHEFTHSHIQRHFMKKSQDWKYHVNFDYQQKIQFVIKLTSLFQRIILLSSADMHRACCHFYFSLIGMRVTVISAPATLIQSFSTKLNLFTGDGDSEKDRENIGRKT